MYTVDNFKKRNTLIYRQGGIVKAKYGTDVRDIAKFFNNLFYPNRTKNREAYTKEAEEYFRKTFGDETYDTNKDTLTKQYIKAREKHENTRKFQSEPYVDSIYYDPRIPRDANGQVPEWDPNKVEWRNRNKEVLKPIARPEIQTNVNTPETPEIKTPETPQLSYWGKRASDYTKGHLTSEDAVKEWQKKAKEAGRYHGLIDGKFGKRSERAWKYYDPETGTFKKSSQRLVSKSKTSTQRSGSKSNHSSTKIGDISTINGRSCIYTEDGWRGNDNGNIIYRHGKFYDKSKKQYVKLNTKTNTWNYISSSTSGSKSSSTSSSSNSNLKTATLSQDVVITPKNNSQNKIWYNGVEYVKQPNGDYRSGNGYVIKKGFQGIKDRSKISYSAPTVGQIKANGENVEYTYGFWSAPSPTDKRWKITPDGYKRMINGSTIWLFKGGYYWKSTNGGKTWQSNKKYNK